jgi:hypothetical protein
VANPTTAKPSTPEWDSAANPNLQFLCPFVSGGQARDLVGNVPARGYDSYSGVCCGSAPIPTTATFGGVTGQATLKWGMGSQGLLWPGRSWASGATVATNRTFAIVLRHYFSAGQAIYSGTTVTQILTVGADGNNLAIALSYTANGVVTWGFWRSSGFFSSGQVLTAGTWYALALTCTSSTGRLFNLYDYTAQSATAQSSVTDTSSYSNSFGSNDNSVAIIQPQSTAAYGGALVEVYAAALANETWDTGANTRFADWYADPCLWGRGSYAPSVSTLVAGTATLYQSTASSVTVTCSRPTGGASSGVYTYQWHRSVGGPTFTPDGTTLQSGATSRTFIDTTAAANTVYYYKCAQSDGSATVNTNGPAGVLARGSLSLGFWGDSETGAGSFAPPGFLAAAVSQGWRVSSQNVAIGATFAGTPGSSTTIQSWKPGTFVLGTTVAGTAGTFTLTVVNGGGTQTTGTIAWNANATAVQTALRALSNVGSSGVTVVGSGSLGGTSTTFALVFAGTALPSPASGLNVTADSTSLTGGPYWVYSNYRNAVVKLLADAATITDIYLHLGTNDAGLLSSSAATFQTDLSNLVSAILAEGFSRVWLNCPMYRWLANSDSTADLVRQYQASIAALVNGTTIRQGDNSYIDAARSPGILHDGLHGGQGGFWGLGFRQWASLQAALDPTGGGVSRARIVNAGGV